MTRMARHMKAQGSARFLNANGRRFKVEGSTISEVLNSDGHTCQVSTGYWRGQPNRGFRSLEEAGVCRRLAMRRPQDRKSFLRQARSHLEWSRSMRESFDGFDGVSMLAQAAE